MKKMKNLRIARLLCAVIFIAALVQPMEGQNPVSGPLIKIETSAGDMVVMLYDETPLHRDNMLKLAREGYYKDQLFHRVIRNFMIQGGDPNSVDAPRGQRLGAGNPGYTIPAEFRKDLFHKKGALAAARTGDQVNPQKESSGSQFYLVQGRVFTVDMLKAMEKDRPEPFTPEEIEAYTTLGGTPHLDGSYTVFGEVVEGMNVLDSIASVPVDSYNRPLQDVVFNILPID
jgi:cyclophilin family peptidyl-prolyl cis-trans isomerase